MFLNPVKKQIMKTKSLLPLIKLSLIPALFCASLSSCFLFRERRTSQSEEGTVFKVSDVAPRAGGEDGRPNPRRRKASAIQCLLKTGGPVYGEEDHSWTMARSVKIESKEDRGRYNSLGQSDSLVYKPENAGSAPSEKLYINNFSLVKVLDVKGKNESRLRKNRKKTIAAGRGSAPLSCGNLLNPDILPDIYGKANYEYDVRFHILGDYLRAVIVAPPKDLPFHALPYSIKISEGRYAMPVGGYPIQIGYLTERENQDFEATNILTFLPLPPAAESGLRTEIADGLPSVYKQSSCSSLCRKKPGESGRIMCPRACRKSRRLDTHFRKTGGFERFQSFLRTAPEKKRDTYPKRIFEGDWHYLLSVTGSNTKNHPYFATQGVHLSSDKIKVEFLNNRLTAYTLNTENDRAGRHGSPSGAKTDDRIVFSIPIQHKEYHFDDLKKQIRQGAALSEKENPEPQRFNMRQAQIRFAEAELPALSYVFGKNFADSAELADIVFSEDYFSFSLRAVHGPAVRVSMLRPEPEGAYKPLYLSKRAWNLFPAFWNRKRVGFVDSYIQSQRFNESAPIGRLDLTSRPAIYRFTSTTPRDDPDKENDKGEIIRNIGREVVNLWNQVFERAGVDCSGEGGKCLELDEAGDAEPGDIRYHTLHFTDPDEPVGRGGLLGYGPSVIDFETGRIVSTQSNNYLNLEYRGIVMAIQEYIMSKLGLDMSFRKAFFRKAAIAASRKWGLFAAAQPDSLRNLFFAGDLSHFGIFAPKALLSLLGKEKSAGSPFFYGLSRSRYGLLRPIASIDEILTEGDKEDIDLLYAIAAGGESKDAAGYEEKQQLILGNSCLAGSRAGGGLKSNAVYKLLEICELPVFYGSGYAEAQNTREALLLDFPHKRLEWLETRAFSAGSVNLSPEGQQKYRLNRIGKTDSAIRRCALKLLPIVNLDTAVHETGHNLPMFHNFAGSYDKNSFIPPFFDEEESPQGFHHKHIFSHIEKHNAKKIQIAFSDPVSSTVMEYRHSKDLVMAPGGYDVGFVRFLYGGRLEIKAGGAAAHSAGGEEAVPAKWESVRVDPFTLQKANAEGIAEGSPLENDEIRPYKQCIYPSRKTEFYCSMWDSGTTAAEIAQNHYDYWVREGDSPWAFFIRTLSIYHEWRKQTARSLDAESGEDSIYLASYSAEEYKKELDSLFSQDTEEAARLSDLYQARNIIFEGLSDYLFHEKDHYCVIQEIHSERMGIQRLLPFSGVKRYYYDYKDHNSGPLSSCYQVKPLRGDSGEATWKAAGELGRPLFHEDFDLGHQLNHSIGGRAAYPFVYDREGSVINRLLSGIAFILPHQRQATFDSESYIHKPLSFMDEPDIRERILEDLGSRLTQGETFKKGRDSYMSLNFTKGESRPSGRKEQALPDGFSSPNFLNEELLWGILSPLLVITAAPNPTDRITGIESALRNMVGIGRHFFDGGNVDIGRIRAYFQVKGDGGYIMRESKEFNPPEGKSTFYLIPYFHGEAAGITKRLLGSLTVIDRKSSLINLARNFREAKNEIDSDFSPANYPDDTAVSLDVRAFDAFVEILGLSFFALLAHKKPYVNALAVALAYDYLEKGEKTAAKDGSSTVFVSDFLAQYLQMSWVLHFKTAMAFKKKCKSLGIADGSCPEARLFPYPEKDLEAAGLSSEDIKAFNGIIREQTDISHIHRADFSGKAVYFDSEAVKTEKWEFNPSNPFIAYIGDYFKSNPKELTEHRGLIFDLYAMEMFRSEKHKESAARAKLKALAGQLKAAAGRAAAHNSYETPSEEITAELAAIAGIEKAAENIRDLRHFLNSMILRDLFIRGLFAQSRVNKHKSSDNEPESRSEREKLSAEERFAAAAVSGKNPVLSSLRLTELADSLSPEFSVDDPRDSSLRRLDFIDSDDFRRGMTHIASALHFSFNFEGLQRLFGIYQNWFKGSQSDLQKILGAKNYDEEWFQSWLQKPEGNSDLNPIARSLTALISSSPTMFADLPPWRGKTGESPQFEKFIRDYIRKDVKSQRRLILNSFFAHLLEWRERVSGGGSGGAGSAAVLADMEPKRLIERLSETDVIGFEAPPGFLKSRAGRGDFLPEELKSVIKCLPFKRGAEENCASY